MNRIRLLATASATALGLAAAPAIAGDIIGTVVDESDTVALQSATVTIAELGRQVVTGRDGRFRIADLPAGSYTLEARYVGVPAERMTVVVPETGTVTADFMLGGENSNTILVTGLGANQSSAINRKRASDTVSDALTRDSIGQFPDQNVAESLRRLPGINVLNDQGEGRFVSVRGLDPSLNATSLNGVRLPSPEADTRAVALDVVSSDVIESIEVKKSLTPDMDGDTIGASIEIQTVSAFDRLRDHYSLKAEGSYNSYADELSPKLGFDMAARISDDVGVSMGASWYKRKFETDNIEADGWQDEDGLIYAEDLEYRDYDVERERFSGSLGFDFRVSDTTDLYARALYSQFDDQEYRRRTTFDFGDAFVTGSGTSVSYADADPSDPGEEYEITVERDIKDRFESQKVKSFSVGGKTDTGSTRISYMGAWARSSEFEDNSVDPAEFRRKFGADGLDVLVDYSNPRVPLYIAGGVADFADASTYELKDIELTDLSDAVDEEFTAKLDVAHEFAADTGVFTVQAGAKGRWRTKKYNKEVGFYELDGLTLADIVGEQTFRLTDMGPVASDNGASDYFFANRGAFEFQPVDSAFDSAVEDYRIDEDIYAVYGLGRWDSDRLTVIGGVRYERTKADIAGNYTRLVEEDGTLPDGTTATDDTVIVSPSRYEKDYGFWLPSLNIKAEPVDDVILRLAGYRSLVRPGFSKVAPRFAAEVNDDDEVEGEFGNPDLRPYKAWNFDASVEYYMTSNGALSAAFFYKDVKDYIVDVEYNAEDLDGNDEIDPDERLVYNGIGFDDAVIPLNGPSATVWGIEVGFAQQWTMLPGALSGLITQLNYTYTDSEGLVPDGGVDALGQVGETRTIPLPSTSKHTLNGVIGYETGPLSLRLAGTYRDKYLDELNGDAAEDRYVADHFQLDASVKFNIGDRIQLFAEAINLTDAEYFAYNMVGGRENLYQYEVYGRTFKGGIKVTY